MRKSDWAYLIPRRYAEAVLRTPHADYFGCRADFNGSESSIEKWLQAGYRRANISWRDDSSTLPALITRTPRTVGYDTCHRFQLREGVPRGAMQGRHPPEPVQRCVGPLAAS